MKKTVIILSLLLGFTVAANAQFSQFHVGAVFPTGKFNDGNARTEGFTDGKGFATPGFTIGYKRYNPLGVENLSWVLGFQAYVNFINSDLKDDTEDDGWKDVKYPIYLNFPATVGLNYAIPLSEKVSLYGEGVIGANLSLPTNFSLENRAGYQDMKYKITPAVRFAFAFEGGLFINKKYSLGVRYNHLGSYKYKYEIEYETAATKKDKFDRKLPITNVSLYVGFLF